MEISSKSILIAGGSGFIGSLLVKKFTQADGRVSILSRNPAKLTGHDRVTMLPWDGVSTKGWSQAIEQTDIVINLVGASLSRFPWSDAYIQRIRSSRLDAGKALVEAITQANHKPEVFIQASGVGYYGINGDREFSEADPPGLDLLARICVDWEQSTAAIETLGVRRIITRSALVFDSEDGVLPYMALPFKLFIGGPVGSGKQWVPWIHKEDEVGAILALIRDDSAQGAYNLTAPGIVTNSGFGRALANVLHRPYWVPAPGFLLRTILGRMSILILDGQKAVPTRLNQQGYVFHFPDLQPALADLYGSN